MTTHNLLGNKNVGYEIFILGSTLSHPDNIKEHGTHKYSVKVNTCEVKLGIHFCARQTQVLTSIDNYFFVHRLQRASSVVQEWTGVPSVLRAGLLGIRGCIQKFPDWPPGARTANGTALCH
jgi:hypothetical protein